MPRLSVLTLREKPVSVLVSVTSALEIPAPLGSTMVPRSDVVEDCGQLGEPGAKTMIEIDIRTRYLPMLMEHLPASSQIRSEIFDHPEVGDELPFVNLKLVSIR